MFQVGEKSNGLWDRNSLIHRRVSGASTSTPTAVSTLAPTVVARTTPATAPEPTTPLVTTEDDFTVYFIDVAQSRTARAL